MDGVVADLIVKWQPPSSGSSSSRMRGTLDRGAPGGARRQTETVRVPARAATGGRPPGIGVGGMTGGRRLLEIETTAVVVRTEIGRRVVIGARAVTEIGANSKLVADGMFDQRGLT